ncbi:MAG: DUF72 domain-containing protein [Proteobacteria bacterium]|nr:DUF72 domain-containing protein [Pseudomonadota bacterium]
MKEAHIGCSGWYYGEWRGHFYPENLSSKDFFDYYKQYFSTVELNSTFYRIPSEKTLQTWYKRAPENFKYSLKVNKYITHYDFFENPREKLKGFYGLSDILREKTGPFLFQFPKKFIYTPKNLEILLDLLNAEYTNVVEFRHLSWWNEEVFKSFKRNNIIFCTSIGFDLSEDIQTTGDALYIRFHGNKYYNLSYTEEDLSSWVKKIKAISSPSSWIYFNNTRHGYAPINALYLKSLLKVNDEGITLT